MFKKVNKLNFFVLNFQVNKQNCSKGLGEIDYDLDNVNNWEHLLVGEPLIKRKVKKKDLDEEDQNDMYDEKHLDMPMSWSMKISIPHDCKLIMLSYIVTKRVFMNPCTIHLLIFSVLLIVNQNTPRLNGTRILLAE